MRTGRPPTPLLELVRSRRFDARNKRHRAKLLHDDSLLEFVRDSGAVTPLDVAVAEIQERYRQAHGTLNRSWTHGEARAFQLSLERLDENGEPTPEAFEALRRSPAA
jgi:hypothetical protein